MAVNYENVITKYIDLKFDDPTQVPYYYTILLPYFSLQEIPYKALRIKDVPEESHSAYLVYRVNSIGHKIDNGIEPVGYEYQYVFTGVEIK